MCVGEKRKIFVPSGMAYGAREAHGSDLLSRVQPDAAVVYDVELLQILDEEEGAPHLVWGP
jgi:FKBP-type peptidyl-prolyl cis-trans isomerase